MKPDKRGWMYERFNLSMGIADVDIPAQSTCTTCRFKEDKSNYWTAVLYFKHPNGIYIRVRLLFLAFRTKKAHTQLRYLRWRTTERGRGSKLVV